MTNRTVRFSLSTAAALLLAAAGCTNTSKQTDAKVEQLQKELDETRNKLAQESAKASSPPAAGAQDSAKPQPPPAPATPATAKGPASDAGAQQTAAANKPAVEEPRPTAQETKPVAPPPPISHTLPAGTAISVRTVSGVSTKTASSGSAFEATLAEPLVVNGYRVAGRGATVEGVVNQSDPGGRVKGVASLSVSLKSIVMDDGRRLPIQTNSVSKEAKSTKKKDAAKVGIASGIGAAIGAIAGGGKGAAIGAGVGGAGGAGVTMATRGAAAEIPSETLLSFRLASPAKFQEHRK